MQRSTNESILNDNILFEKKCLEIESWLTRIESRLEHMAPIGHSTDVLEAQIREQKLFFGEFNQYKFQIEKFNELTQRLLTFYQNEPKSLRIKKIAETICQNYMRLNSSIINRGKCLNTAISSLQNFDQSLDKFLSWIGEMESSLINLNGNIDSNCDSDQRYVQLKQQLKDLQTEIENHADIYNQLRINSNQLLGSLTQQQDINLLETKIEKLDQRWHNLKSNVMNILNRLENNDEYWNSLLLTLRELIEWVIRKDTELTGIMSETSFSLQKQTENHNVFRQQIEDKRPIVDNNLINGRQILANELSNEEKSFDRPKFWSQDETNKELIRNIRREVSKLSEKWNALIERSDQWAHKLDKSISMLSNFQVNLNELFKNICGLEKASLTWSSPRTAAEAKEMLKQLEQLEVDLAPLQEIFRDIKEQMLMFSATNICMPFDIASQLDDCSARWKALTAAVDDRYKQLASCSQGDLSPSLDGKIVTSVEAPWERNLTPSKVPYYINHSTETTHWDHPKMLSLMNDLLVLNEIRYSAYRTALKLRSLQKTLCLDLITLQIVLKSFDLHGLRAQNDKLIDVPDMILVLRAMFVDTVSVYAQMINQPLCVDLVLNWLLNVYDSSRTGQIRVLSFKVGLVLMCNGSLEEKYKYLYRIIADPEQKVEQRKLGLLLHDIIQIPRQLGEIAAFGGSNIEPSVRSCFKLAAPSNKIEAVHFLSWLQQEPQSLVWLPVLHRIFVSETIKHGARCNICKQQPILGLRYRCLKCLNFDLCQNCFFLGRTINGHKFSHPLHEYCLPTSSIEDIRDFVRAICNKFRSKQYFKKNCRLGYLPVRTLLEGDELESAAVSPLGSYAIGSNRQDCLDGRQTRAAADDEHNLIAKYCNSLTRKTPETGFRDRIDSLCSPGQLIEVINEEHRNELQLIIRDLELENEALQKEYDRLKSHEMNSRHVSDSELSEDEQEMLNEAKKLRQHKNRLETRMRILEDHNRQLEAQLQRLRQLLEQPSSHKMPMLQTRPVTASHLCMESPEDIPLQANLDFFNQ